MPGSPEMSGAQRDLLPVLGPTSKCQAIGSAITRSLSMEP